MSENATLSAKKLSQSDRNAAIGPWLKFIPNPYEFTPTAEQPICEVPSVGGRDFSHAYGVLYSGVGLTGRQLSAVQIRSWDWYTDRPTARRQAFYRMWLESPAARDWLIEPIPDEVTWELLRQSWQQQAETPDGLLTLFRIITKSGFGYAWYMTPDQEEAIAKQRRTLFETRTQAMGKPSLVIPTDQAHPDEVPEVASIQCDTCPWTGEPIMAHGSACVVSRIGLQKDWFATLEEATEARNQVKAHLRFAAEQRQEAENLSVAKALYAEASTLAWQVSESKDYTHFHELPHIVGLSTELYIAHRSEGVTSTEGYVAAADRLDKAVKTISTALAAEHEQRLNPWLQDNAFSQLRECLQSGQAVCPLCGKNYVTDDVVEDLVVYGQIQLLCCGELGLSADPQRLAEGQTTVPAIIAELDRWARRASNSSGETSVRLFERGSSCMELGRILLGGQVAVRVLAYHRNMCRWHVILEVPAETNLLPLIQGITCVATDCLYKATWPTQRSSLERWWSDRLEAMVDEGQAVWLRLDNHPQHGWGARRRERGTMVAYKISNPDPQGYDSKREYFCRVTRVPEHAKKPGFELRIVQPDPDADL